MTQAEHLEILVEEPSMELFLASILPRMLNGQATFAVHSHQGKSDLLQKLGSRLRAYAKWMPASWRIIVLVDRDDEQCKALKEQLEREAAQANLRSRSAGKPWNFASRIAIEELEAWYFGNWSAVVQAYPRVNENVPLQAGFRDPDNIKGGTWEALERVLQRGGYFIGGLRKLEVAQQIGQRFDHAACASQSFCTFREAVLEAVEACKSTN